MKPLQAWKLPRIYYIFVYTKLLQALKWPKITPREWFMVHTLVSVGPEISLKVESSNCPSPLKVSYMYFSPLFFLLPNIHLNRTAPEGLYKRTRDRKLCVIIVV
uniref:Uncharacterized protein n=1 Tax=Cacopsylla melanoneura TaxID=428564 RepID=A0A8D8Z5H5_9HEMI